MGRRNEHFQLEDDYGTPLAPPPKYQLDREDTLARPWYDVKSWGWKLWAAIVAALVIIIVIVVAVVVVVTKQSKYPDYSKLNYEIAETCMCHSLTFDSCLLSQKTMGLASSIISTTSLDMTPHRVLSITSLPKQQLRNYTILPTLRQRRQCSEWTQVSQTRRSLMPPRAVSPSVSLLRSNTTQGSLSLTSNTPQLAVRRGLPSGLSTKTIGQTMGKLMLWNSTTSLAMPRISLRCTLQKGAQCLSNARKPARA